MNPVDFINITRETQRLIIRPTREEDFGAILEGLKDQEPKQSICGDEELELAGNHTEAFFNKSVQNLKQAAEEDRTYLFRVFKKEKTSYIGGVIIKTIFRKEYQWAEIGYWLINQHWGNGYGSEMVKAGIDIAFHELGFHRLEAHVNLDNFPSQKTAEKAGMELECIRKGFIHEFDTWADNMVFVINNTESVELQA